MNVAPGRAAPVTTKPENRDQDRDTDNQQSRYIHRVTLARKRQQDSYDHNPNDYSHYQALAALARLDPFAVRLGAGCCGLGIPDPAARPAKSIRVVGKLGPPHETEIVVR